MREFELTVILAIPNLILLLRRLLEDGDIVNVDVTAFKESCHGDTSKTFLVGNVVCSYRLPLSCFSPLNHIVIIIFPGPTRTRPCPSHR